MNNGWESVATDFIRHRRTSNIGEECTLRWASRLPPGGTILDLGCGSGVPISKSLHDRGFAVHGVEASPTLVAEFARVLPGVPIECGPVESSPFFDRHFDGVIAWGLMFLLDEPAQRSLIPRVAEALKERGSFLFTAPAQEFRWPDLSTGRESVSLGESAYRALLEDSGLEVIATLKDEGDNHYYESVKR